MYTGIYFLIEAIFYMALLIIIYFGKKRFKNIENQTYSILVVVAFIELLLELILDYVGPLYNQFPLLSFFVAKMYCCFLQLWITNLCLYVVIVVLTNRTDLIKQIKKIFYIGLLIILISIIVLPIQFHYDGMIAYTSGIGVNIVYISSFIFSIVGFVSIFINRKKIKNKKFIPMIVFLIIGSGGAFLQFENPGLLLAVPIHAFITFVMYFTIENPDMKMLEEVHKAKEISDNANEEKTLFLYNMTNDIKSITKDIDDSADYILEEMDNSKVDKELIKETARDIKSSTAKFTTMTNEILDISSIDTYSIKVYNNKYNIKLLLRGLITEYKAKCKEKNITFRSSIDTTLPEYLYGDSVSLKKAIDTLLENSYKYTEKGYIELNVNTIIKNDIARLIISVEDSGIGMKVEELNRAINTRKEEDSTNLTNNLYNAKKLITLMNGRLMPSSTIGKGTIMKIVLDQKIYNEVKEVAKYSKELDKKKVLLVDDNASSQKIFTKILSSANIDLDIVSLGKECLDKIRNKEKYDLILLDEEMKPLSGIEVINKLKSIKNFNTKVILLTKNNEYEYNEDYIKYGFIDYILKPLDKSIVLEKISKYLK